MTWGLSIQSTAAHGGALHSRRKRMSAPPERSRQQLAAHRSDLDLVQQARAGNAIASEQLIGRLSCIPAMLRELHRRYGAPLGADELVEVEQSTLAALWSKLASFQGRASLETWAYRFTQHELLKAFERRDRRRLYVEDSEGHLARAEQPVSEEPAVDARVLAECIERVGPPACDVIRARHFEELSFEVIAERYAEPVNTIKARYYRGLERLRELLEPHRRRTL